MTENKLIELEKEARERLDGYLGEVRKGLDGVDPKERKAILEEIGGALNEKIQMTAEEKGVRKVDAGMAGEVLEGFGSPSELAGGYARVARTGPGRAMKLLSMFEAFWAVFLLIPGTGLLWDAIIFWYPGADLVCYGQVMLGIFLVAGCASIFALAWLQLRDPAIRPDVGPFALLTTFALGIFGLLTAGRNQGFLFPGLPGGVMNALLLAMAVFLILGSVWGFRGLLASIQKERAAAMEEPLQGSPRRFSSKGRNTIAVTMAVLVSLFIISEGLLMTWSGPGASWPPEGEKVFVSSEQVGGPYNASIEEWAGYTDGSWIDFYKIVYTVDGQRIEGAFEPSVRPALDWIRSNLPGNATILSWWDYGHMIRGYTGRGSVVYYPSRNLLDTVADKASIEQFEAEERVRMVAETFLSLNSSGIRERMQALGASHLFTASRDASGIAWAFFEGAGLDPDIYISNRDGVQTPNEKSRDMFLFKIWNAGEFNGTKVDYKDICSQVLELI